MVSTETQGRVWNLLLDSNRLTRYYGKLASRMIGRRSLRTLALGFFATSAAVSLLNIIPPVVELVTSAAVALLTVWMMVDNHAQKLAVVRLVSERCQELETPSRSVGPVDWILPACPLGDGITTPYPRRHTDRRGPSPGCGDRALIRRARRTSDRPGLDHSIFGIRVDGLLADPQLLVDRVPLAVFSPGILAAVDRFHYQVRDRLPRAVFALAKYGAAVDHFHDRPSLQAVCRPAGPIGIYALGVFVAHPRSTMSLSNAAAIGKKSSWVHAARCPGVVVVPLASAEFSPGIVADNLTQLLYIIILMP